MKKFILLLIATLLCNVSFAQSAELENIAEGVKSGFSVEFGLNSGITYEQRLSKSFSLATTASYDNRIWVSKTGDGIVFKGMYPTFKLAPRWYYFPNQIKGRLNSGGFFALEIGYMHLQGGGIFVKRRHKSDYESGAIIFQPTWGYNWMVNRNLYLKFRLGYYLGSEQDNFFRIANDGKLYGENGENLVIDLGILYAF